MGRGIQRHHASSRRLETRMDNASWVPETLLSTFPSDPLHNLREKKKLAGWKTEISDTILEGLYLPETWNNKVFFKIKKINKTNTSISEIIFDQIKNSGALLSSLWRKQKPWKCEVSIHWPNCSFLCPCRKPASSILYLALD